MCLSEPVEGTSKGNCFMRRSKQNILSKTIYIKKKSPKMKLGMNKQKEQKARTNKRTDNCVLKHIKWKMPICVVKMNGQMTNCKNRKWLETNYFLAVLSFKILYHFYEFSFVTMPMAAFTLHLTWNFHFRENLHHGWI